MKQEISWGVAAALAVVAAVGISTQTGSRAPAAVNGSAISPRTVHPTPKPGVEKLEQPQCEDSIPLLKQFFLRDIAGPGSCYGDKKPTVPAVDPEFQPDFIIATLPDPLHTHFSLLFDRFIEAIQQGAQDEGYDYDSSWLPWELEERVLPFLADQDKLDDRKTAREEQPGILLFRNQKQPYYNRALIVFIVGEEPTRGIHRPQFQNAIAWIKALQNPADGKRPSVAILGPTFSGSFPSLEELLAADSDVSSFNGGVGLSIYSGSASSGDDGKRFADAEKSKNVDFRSFIEDDQIQETRFCRYLSGSFHFDMARLAVLSEDETAYGAAYSRWLSVSNEPANPDDKERERKSKGKATAARNEAADGIAKDKPTTIEGKGKDEDPTANAELTPPGAPDYCEGANRIYYPRDISMLRAAYQNQSIFSSPQQGQDNTQRKGLATDMADPGGDEHDTVRSYAGNQTALSQEAQLLGIVDALRTSKAQYVLLRSSNTLDPLFLANFLRRDYSDARIVVLNSDLLFQRGQDALALSGVMTLSTYPLFSWAREWTAQQYDSRSHRVFPENSTQGTYIAERLLLQTLLRANLAMPSLLEKQARDNLAPPPLNCLLPDEKLLDPKVFDTERFAPPLHCQISVANARFAQMPDYAPPYWADSGPCTENSADHSCKPATWLSVITRSGTWPLAAINESTLPMGAKDRTGESTTGSLPAQVSVPAPSAVQSQAPGTTVTKNKIGPPRSPTIPRGMKALLAALCGLALFHALCCGFASFTAKPAIRAHFASAGRRHKALILIGSFLTVVMALIAGWGCGIFARSPIPEWHTLGVRFAVWIGCGLAALGMVVNIVITRVLNPDNEMEKLPHQRVHPRPHFEAAEGEDERLSVAKVIRETLWPLAVSILMFAALVGLFYLGWVDFFESSLGPANRAFAYWRSMNLPSGTSPIVPFLALAAGLYLWFWYALHGLALFGPDRPRLPREENLLMRIPPKEARGKPKEIKLSMFSEDQAGDPAERVAKPLAGTNLLLCATLFVAIALLTIGLARELPVRSLGAWHYAFIFCICLDFYISLTLTEAWQIWKTWNCARQLLVFLDRMALRRTLGALHGFSWGSVWKMSGNVLDVRYKLLSRQLECLNHLRFSLGLAQAGKAPESSKATAALPGIAECTRSVDQSLKQGANFSLWYTEHYRKPRARRTPVFEILQKQIAKTTGVVLIELLVPATRLEEHSLIQVDPSDKKADDRALGPPPGGDELVRNAEELVCLTYLGFVQNLLGRIRTIALGGMWLFVATTVAVSSYPFDPRPMLSGVLLALFCGFGGAVVFVYADMHRDATLSHVTNTKPGELGSEFWFKVLGYGAAPMLGLVTQLFPEWAGFLFSWLQPGLSSLK